MRAITNVIALAALVSGSVMAMAEESGLAGLHSWRQVGSKTCFDDHFHDGSGSGPTQRAAMTEAIKSWESFTSLEYGSTWAAYSNSISKSATCDRASTTFSCHVASIPCKGGVFARQDRRPAGRGRGARQMRTE